MAEAGKQDQDKPKIPRVPGKALFKKGGFKTFFNDVAKEMRQTTWPSTEETWRFTGIVLVVIFVFVAYLFVWDTGIGKTMDSLIGGR